MDDVTIEQSASNKKQIKFKKLIYNLKENCMDLYLNFIIYYTIGVLEDH